MMSPSLLDRSRGCLLAGAVGDALGAGIEFESLSSIRRKHGPDGVDGYLSVYGRRGAFTDDTQMALFTADGLIRASLPKTENGIQDPATAVWHAYQRWLHTQGQPWERCDHPPQEQEPSGWLVARPELHARRAPGNTCLSALQGGRMGTPEVRLNDSKGCGGVMRVAPAGFLDPRRCDPFEVGVRTAALTHSHPTGYLAAGGLAEILSAVVEGEALRDAIAAGRQELRRRENQDHEETTDALANALERSHGAVSAEELEAIGAGWIAEEALAISVYCALAYEDEDDPTDRMRRSLLLAVNHSGDSDSTGCITGHLLGALLGIEAIPGEWLEELEGRELIDTVARDLVEVLRGETEMSRDLRERYPVPTGRR